MQDFLQRVLGHNQFQVLPLAGDASTRRYFRVVSSEDQTFVLMVWEPFVDDGNYPFLSVLEHFGQSGVSVPKVVAKSPSDGLILLEDLGDLTLERKFWENQDQSLAMPYYQQAIDELIKIHFASSEDRGSSATCFKVEFDTEKLLWEMNYGREHLLLKLCKVSLTPAETKVLDSVFLRICERLHRQEKFVAHRDYHSRNVMLKHGKVRIIDFQDARLGPIQYDLVSLLRDSYVKLSDASVRLLLNYYLDCRSEVAKEYHLSSISRLEFDETFELQAIQRCFKACGSFASFYNLRGDTRYLKYLRFTIGNVKRALDHFTEYREFMEVLHRHGIFEKEFEKNGQAV